MTRSRVQIDRRTVARGAVWTLPVVAVISAAPAYAVSVTVTQTVPGSYTFNVPAGVLVLNYAIKGGAGGGYSLAPTGGSGASFSGTITFATNPTGITLTYIVGGGGAAAGAGGAGGSGYGVGGTAGAVTITSQRGAGGGGGSAILLATAPIVVAGGGGGAGTWMHSVGSAFIVQYPHGGPAAPAAANGFAVVQQISGVNRTENGGSAASGATRGLGGFTTGNYTTEGSGGPGGVSPGGKGGNSVPINVTGYSASGGGGGGGYAGGGSGAGGGITSLGAGGAGGGAGSSYTGGTAGVTVTASALASAANGSTGAGGDGSITLSY